MSEQIDPQVEEKYRALKASTFKQQTLPAFRPSPTFFSTQVSFLTFFIILLSIGIHLFSESSKIKEVVTRYDAELDCADETKPQCTVNINVPEDLPGQVFVYFELDNFYQNHRTYVKSRSND